MSSGLAAGAIALSGGGTGLLSVPSAAILPYGVVEVQHSTGILPLDGNGGLARLASDTERALSDHIQIGVTPWLELGARLTTWYNQEGRRSQNDLAAHMKLQLFQSDSFRFAVGTRDVAGEDGGQKFPGYFAVGDWKNDRWEVVAGFGQSSIDNIALGGPFGGVRFAATPWLDLLSDYDGIAWNNGLRLHAQWQSAGVYVQAHHTTFEAQNVVLAAGLRFALGDTAPIVSKRKTPVDLAPVDTRSRKAVGEFPVIDESYEFLEQRDGAAALARSVAASQHSPTANGCARKAQARAQAVPLLQLGCERGQAELRWLTHWQAWNKQGMNWSASTPISIRVEPALRYALGTELGRMDIAAALRSGIEWHSPMGLGAYSVWDVPAFNSSEYEEDGAFAQSRFESGEFESALQWTLHALPGVFAQATVGQTHIQNLPADFERAEVAAMLWQGRLALNYSYTSLDRPLSSVTDAQSLATAFVWLKHARYALQVTAGEHLYGDQGTRVDALSYLGRSRVGLYFKTGEGDQAVGLQVSVSLTPRRAFGNNYFTIAGTSHFTPGLETQVNSDNGANTLRPNFLQAFVPQRNLIEDVLDQWRFSPYAASRQ
jgi:hypothetical protein